MFAGDEEQQHKKMERLVAVQRVSLAGDSRNAKQKRVERQRHCSVPKRDLLVFLQRSLFFTGNTDKGCWQRHLQRAHILSRTRVKFRELLPRLEECGVCFFFLIKNWDRRVVAVEPLCLTFSPVRKGRGGRERTGSSV